MSASLRARPTLGQRVATEIAFFHARRTSAAFFRSLSRSRAQQQQALRRALRVVAGSALARSLGLAGIRDAAEFRRRVPLMTYEDLRPYIDRIAQGETDALFAPGVTVLMFASSSGTTARPKLIPVTPQFVRDYRRGWNIFGLKMLNDHPDAVMRPILQGTGRMDSQRSPAGIPIGAITGLLARTQKRIVRRFYVGVPEIAEVSDPRGRYYTLMRLAAGQDVAFAITANPATLIEMARVADAESESLIRDVHDGTLNEDFAAHPTLRGALGGRLAPNPSRAREIEGIRRAAGVLRPRDLWNLSFLGCWTAGSMSHYLSRLREWWGDLPVRDLGLLASEGRISIPMADNTPAGVLDVEAAFFEFIPVEEAEAPRPQTLLSHELRPGARYEVVLTNSAGLLRYRLRDVVQVCGHQAGTPVVEFLYRGGRVSSVAGEKLTENQVVAAVRKLEATRGIELVDFVIAPVLSDPPFYQLSVELNLSASVCSELDVLLGQQNEEYRDRRRSNRLGPLQARTVPPGTFKNADLSHLQQRGGTSEQFKRIILHCDPLPQHLA